MQRITFSVLALLWCSVAAIGAELGVPDEMIGADTVAVISLNLSSITREQVVGTATALTGTAPDEGAMKQFDELNAKIKEAGALGISSIINIPKGADAAKLDDSNFLVVKKKEGGDNVKIAELLYAMIPEIKTGKHADCPMEVGGSLVWFKASNKMPTADADRLKAFENAHAQVAVNQTISVVFVPDENAVAAAKGKLPPAEAELVEALMGGDGICFFSDLGAAAEPHIKLLILSPDAGAADKLTKAAQALIDEAKKGLPAPMAPLMDTLKLVSAGTNVQLSLNFAELTKVAKELMAAMAPPPAGK